MKNKLEVMRCPTKVDCKNVSILGVTRNLIAKAA